MRFYVCVLAALAAIVLSSCTKQVDSLQYQIDDLSSGRIATLEEQQDSIRTGIVLLTAADAALTEYVASLETEINKMDATVAAGHAAVSAMQGTVTSLKAAQVALQQSVSDLTTYVETGFNGLRGWATGTFATLEQHAALCATVAQLEVSVQKNSDAVDSLRKDMVTECRSMVMEAVKDVENNIKSWVNEQLAGYWTIEQTQAKLDALSAAEKTDSAALAADIAKARTDLTAAYQKYVTEAIEGYDGVIKSHVAAELKKVNDTLTAEIDAINVRLTAAERSIALLLNQIQSITPVPVYNDGSQRIDILEYVIFPDSVAKKVAKKKELFTIRYTTTTLLLNSTKSNAVTNLPVSSVTYTDGVVKVAVDYTGLPDDFISGKIGASACLVIEGDGNSRASNYASLTYKGPSFSVSAKTRVVFATGNVQYRASTDTWRFAEHQYDYVGNAAGNTTAKASRSTQSAWIDLFGWGATGYNSYSEKPYSISTDDSKYKTQSTAAADEKLTIANKCDWGYCFNSGNDGWRLMTADECSYLLETRTDAAKKLGYATVAGKTGLIILPDIFFDPKVNTSSKATGKAFVPKTATGFDANVYDASAWETMENAGAVFLPAGGCGYEASVYGAGSEGYYWLSSAYSAEGAYQLYFLSCEVYRFYNYRGSGRSVRLVAESE